MKLFELKGVKKFQHLTTYKILRFLQRYGIEMTGLGTFGQVFTHPDWDYVVKTFRKDEPYLDFINYVSKHKNPSKHFPKIVKKPMRMHLFHKRERGDNMIWVVKIEKLKPLSPDLSDWFTRHFLWAYRCWSKRDVNPDFKTKWKSGIDLPDGTQAKLTSWKEAFEQFPWLESLCRAYSEIEKLDHAFDENGENFMMRDDGTIVITDPVVDRKWQPRDAYAEFARRELELTSPKLRIDDETEGASYEWKEEDSLKKITKSFIAKVEDS